MTLSPEQWIYAAAVLFSCSILQSTVGFAFSLMALPLLLFVGLPLAETVALVTLGSVLQRLFSVYHLRDAIPGKELLPLIGVGVVAVPVGVLLLKALSMQSKDVIQQAVGAMILLALLIQYGIKVKPRPRVPMGWGVLAALVAGMLNGFGNIGGPPIVLWTHAHTWSNERLRVATMAFSLPLVPLQFALYYFKFGTPILHSILGGLMLCPLVFAGAWVGLKVGKALPVPLLRSVVTGLLLVIGVSAVCRPFFQ